ncbi:alpha/beta hydrolase [Membranihabitans maritimus]|uniref:alpha/beta hydrolase n=1 Tax=Membranihabitans maritimus TaxID=2904244 RepID=UPI001F2833DA|nr:alpha/beta hydrolase [Membranihabitans maritimus]
MKSFILVMGFLIGSLSYSYSQDLTKVYKKFDTTELSMDIYLPEDYKDGNNYPAMVFFFGGGWHGGNVNHFQPHAEYFSSRGIVCFAADYRVKSRQGTSPFESLKDAKSAIRYVRENAKEYKIDPSRIIASGGSAGGHLAAATAFVEKYNEEGDNMAISCVPNVLVLFNPVIDNGPGGYGYERIGDDYKAFSPLHNIREGAPPTILFLGTKDKLIPVETVKYYKKVMERVGSRCDLFLYQNEPHGFFNYSHPDNYISTVREADKFLNSLGYLEGAPKAIIDQ